MRDDEIHGVCHAHDLFALLVRDLDGKLLLNGHHHLDGVKGVQAKIRKLHRGVHFACVDLLEIRDDVYDALSNLTLVKKCVRGERAGRGELGPSGSGGAGARRGRAHPHPSPHPHPNRT